VGLEPFGVGPGDRSEPFDELGWLPVGETTGLEPLRPKSLMVASVGGVRAEEAVQRAVVRDWERSNVEGVKETGTTTSSLASTVERRLAHPGTRMPNPMGHTRANLVRTRHRPTHGPRCTHARKDPRCEHDVCEAPAGLRQGAPAGLTDLRKQQARRARGRRSITCEDSMGHALKH
jgi:hypothetical protein